MLRKNKKELGIAIVIVFCLFLFLGIFAFLYYDSGGLKNQDDLIVKYNPDNILKIDNRLPISDKFAKDVKYSSMEDGVIDYSLFSIKNKLNKDVYYEIYLTKVKSKKEISEDYIKFYMTDNNDNPLDGFDKNEMMVYRKLGYLTDMPSSKLLYSGVIKANDLKKYKLKMWLSDSYMISNLKEEFSCQINVRIK